MRCGRGCAEFFGFDRHSTHEKNRAKTHVARRLSGLSAIPKLSPRLKRGVTADGAVTLWAGDAADGLARRACGTSKSARTKRTAAWLHKPALSSTLTAISTPPAHVQPAYSGRRWYPPPRTRLRAGARTVTSVEGGLTSTMRRLQAPRRSYCIDLLAAATADSTLDTRNETGTCPRSAQLLSCNHQIPIISRGPQEVDTCSHPHPCTKYFDAEFTKSSGAARMMPWSNSSPAEWPARRDARLTRAGERSSTLICASAWVKLWNYSEDTDPLRRGRYIARTHALQASPRWRGRAESRTEVDDRNPPQQRQEARYTCF